MQAGDLSGELAWWRAQRNSVPADVDAMRELLVRLKAWKAEHDQDRARQPGPFLQLAWDAVFSDEDDQVEQAIRQLEDALASSSASSRP
jgi:hypothetical protein